MYMRYWHIRGTRQTPWLDIWGWPFPTSLEACGLDSPRVLPVLAVFRASYRLTPIGMIVLAAIIYLLSTIHPPLYIAMSVLPKPLRSLRLHWPSSTTVRRPSPRKTLQHVTKAGGLRSKVPRFVPRGVTRSLRPVRLDRFHKAVPVRVYT